eukprot:1159356-Pelagomonas_calceolata.AAC.3
MVASSKGRRCTHSKSPLHLPATNPPSLLCAAATTLLRPITGAGRQAALPIFVGTAEDAALSRCSSSCHAVCQQLPSPWQAAGLSVACRCEQGKSAVKDRRAIATRLHLMLCCVYTLCRAPATILPQAFAVHFMFRDRLPIPIHVVQWKPRAKGPGYGGDPWLFKPTMGRGRKLPFVNLSASGVNLGRSHSRELILILHPVLTRVLPHNIHANSSTNFRCMAKEKRKEQTGLTSLVGPAACRQAAGSTAVSCSHPRVADSQAAGPGKHTAATLRICSTAKQLAKKGAAVAAAQSVFWKKTNLFAPNPVFTPVCAKAAKQVFKERAAAAVAAAAAAQSIMPPSSSSEGEEGPA